MISVSGTEKGNRHKCQVRYVARHWNDHSGFWAGPSWEILCQKVWCSFHTYTPYWRLSVNVALGQLLWRSLMWEELYSRRIMRGQAEAAIKDTHAHGMFSVEYLTPSEYSKRIDPSLHGMERVLMCWDPGNPSLMYCLDLRQIDPSKILSDSDHGLVWITLSKSGEITRTPST